MVVQLQVFFAWERCLSRWSDFNFFLFISALDILFYLIKSKSEIKRLAIFDHCYLYSAYAIDTTFFLQETIWSMYYVYYTYIYAIYTISRFDTFFIFFWIKTKLSKIWNCGYWSSEGGSSGNLWYAFYRSK